MEPLLQLTARADVGVRIRLDHLPQPSRSVPLRIALQQAGDLGQVEHPEELRLLQRLLGEVAVDGSEVKQRAGDRGDRDALDERHLVWFERRSRDPNVAVLARAWASGDFGPAVVGADPCKAAADLRLATASPP